MAKNEQFDKSLKDLSELVRLAQGDVVRKDELKSLTDALVKVWGDMRGKVDEDMTSSKENVEKMKEIQVKILEAFTEELEEEFKYRSENNKKEFEKLRKELTGLTTAEVAKLKDALNDIEDIIPDAVDMKPVFAKLADVEGRVVSEAELEEIEERCEERVEKLEEEIKKLKKAQPSMVRGLFGGRPAHIAMVDDFSTETDGSTKEFYLTKQPRSHTTMKIWGSDFPYILRPTVDFTVAGKKVTLTAEVDAPTSGATLIVEYYI